MGSTELLERGPVALSRAQIWTLAVACVSVALVIASMAALYTALPRMAADTGANQGQLTWIVDGYTLALSCLVLPAGALGDRYGRRRTLILGLLVFAAASAAPLLRHDPTLIIASRAVAGAGAALVMPSTLSLLTAGFPRHWSGRAVGIWAGVAGAGGVLGLIGSGLLLEIWSWRSIFLGMAAAATVLMVVALAVPESRDRVHAPMDPTGALLVAAGIGMVVFAATEAPVRGWLSPLVLGLFVGGAAALAVFTVVELRIGRPLLDVRLFARRRFGSGTLCITFTFFMTFGLFLVQVQTLQLILGFAPLAAAVAMAPSGAPLAVVSVMAHRLTARLGLKVMTSGGLFVLAVGLWGVSRMDVGIDYVHMLWPMLVISVGLGMCMAPATAAIVGDTPPEKQGVAAAVNDASRELGATIGVAVAGSVLAAGYSSRVASILPRLPEPARGPVSNSLAAALEVAHRAGPQAKPLVDFAKAAFIHGADQAALVLAVVTAVGAVILAFWAPRS
jgi:EmrB/QacA subfamily drug resistance transporter